VLPHFVQNRCYSVTGWDRQVRQFCAANDMVYQGFSLLTANQKTLTHPELVNLASRYSRTVCQIAFRFALDVGMLPLTGTSNATNMREDLDVLEFHLQPQEALQIEALAERTRSLKRDWKK